MQITSRWETRWFREKKREKRSLCSRTAAKECRRPAAARFRNRAAGPRAEKSRACFSFFVYLSLSLWAASSSRKCGRCDTRGGETAIIRCPVLERW